MSPERFGPMCPVCHIALEGVGFPLPKKGTGRCPNGGLYAFEIETNENESEVKRDKFGNIMKDKKFKTNPINGDQHEYKKESSGDKFAQEGKDGEKAFVAPVAGNPYHVETKNR
jgi:hypothetical protein